MCPEALPKRHLDVTWTLDGESHIGKKDILRNLKDFRNLPGRHLEKSPRIGVILGSFDVER